MRYFLAMAAVCGLLLTGCVGSAQDRLEYHDLKLRDKREALEEARQLGDQELVAMIQADIDYHMAERDKARQDLGEENKTRQMIWGGVFLAIQGGLKVLLEGGARGALGAMTGGVA